MKAAMNKADFMECLVEELKLNGFDVKANEKGNIEYHAIFGLYEYKLAHLQTYMHEYFRFIMCLGMKMQTYGLESKLKLN